MKFGKRAGIILAAAGVAAVGAYCLLTGPSRPEVPGVPDGQETGRPAEADRPSRRIADPAAKGSPSSAQPVQPEDRKPERGGVVDDLTPADRLIEEDLAKCRESEDVAELAKVVARAAKSANPEIRQDALDTIRVFGKRGMLELMPFMTDTDDDVREESFSVWRDAFFEIEDDDEKSRLITTMMSTLTDRPMLELMTQQITELDDRRRVRTLVDLIESGNKVVRPIALAEYKDFTDADFTSREDAAKWLEVRAAEFDDNSGDNQQEGSKDEDGSDD